MRYLLLAIWFISQTVGFSNLTLTFFIWRRMKKGETRTYFLLMLAFYLLIFALMLDSFLEGIDASTFLPKILTYGAMSFLAVILAEWSLQLRGIKNRAPFLFPIIAFYSLLLILHLLGIHLQWSPIFSHLFFAGFALSIIFMIVTSMSGKITSSIIPARHGRLITLGALILLPGFILVDLFFDSAVFLHGIIPAGFHFVPIFFAYWSVINLCLSWSKLTLLVTTDKFAVDWGLSPRETEVLKELHTGATYNSIAENLFVSLSTVKSHVESIYRKAGVSSRAELIHRIKE